MRTYLKHLEADGKITRAITHGLTLITVCNYRKFQDGKNQDNPPDNQRITHEQPSSNPAVTHEQPIIEERKEGKERKEDDAREAFNQRVVDAAGLFIGSCLTDLHLIQGWLDRGLGESFIIGEIGRIRSNKLARGEEVPSSLRYYERCLAKPSNPKTNRDRLREIRG